ncbi:gliding motility protein GldB-related protein [Faecalibacter rhinopitheci]|jgi:hypothetical protein|uniref:DUF2268 domain-containing protein n=1 Tax=Faecalibacter rhinopitheci TaxID=2779678 RepID=A0A8J7K5L7_9FLAO|nr:DUF2268 domain-containing putative Zn-dependent protease [Faecalibacter rhinopitheci]MBF0598433.1 hypothetical protein [Faecalibacter rhinopitheci]
MNTRFLILLIFFSNYASCQTINFKNYIETSDINRFWIAYDAVKNLNDSNNKLQIFENIYIKNASNGLMDFINSRNFTSEKWIKSFAEYPKFWNSIRPKTENIQKDFKKVEYIYKKFQKIYPDFNPPKIYFTIGNLKGGGTVINGNLIIGSELASSDKTVDYSELPNNYQDRMKINSGILFLTAHELVHTQQNLNSSDNANLLGQCLKEGSADFIAELILNKKVEAPYIDFGNKNQCEIWNRFNIEMYSYDFQNWLSNTATAKNMPADLGYFIGYIITKNYYKNSLNKKLAIKEILTLNFADKNATENFLKQSKYQCK